MKAAKQIFLYVIFVSVFISCSNDEPKETTPLAIGDIHQGGIIFYLNSTGQHGLVCALNDQSAGAEWCSSVTEISGADGSKIGTGSQNTADIVAGCGTPGSAADLCASLSLNSYDDWFLPSKDELNEMYLNKSVLDAAAQTNGGSSLANDAYWSSTELNVGSVSSAQIQDFSNVIQGSLTKFGTAHVRAIRAF